VVSRDRPDRPIGLITRSGLWTALESAKQQQAVRRVDSHAETPAAV
jgi:hypothetical protein